MSKLGMAKCKQYLKARGVRQNFTIEVAGACWRRLFITTIQSTT